MSMVCFRKNRQKIVGFKFSGKKPAKPSSLGTSLGSKYSHGPASSKWVWPIKGELLNRFSTEDPVNKGIDIGGKLGTL